jgi:hypothetical protein
MWRKLISDVGEQSGELVGFDAFLFLVASSNSYALPYLSNIFLLYTVNLLSCGIILFGSEFCC